MQVFFVTLESAENLFEHTVLIRLLAALECKTHKMVSKINVSRS